MMFEQTVTRLRAPLVADRHRNQVRDWGAAAELLVEYVNVQPVSQYEDGPGANRDRVVDGWRLYTAPGDDLDLQPTDRVRLDDGQVLEVVGDVARWPDPHTGGVHHVEANLQRVRG